MGLSATIKRISEAKLGGEFIRQIVLPLGDGALLVGGAGAWGDWADICAIADIITETLVVGVEPSACNGAGDQYTIDIGITQVLGVAYANAAAVIAAGAAVIAAAHRAQVKIADHTLVGFYGQRTLTIPVYVPNGVGIIGRLHTTAASNCRVSLELVQNF